LSGNSSPSAFSHWTRPAPSWLNTNPPCFGTHLTFCSHYFLGLPLFAARSPAASYRRGSTYVRSWHSPHVLGSVTYTRTLMPPSFFLGCIKIIRCVTALFRGYFSQSLLFYADLLLVLRQMCLEMPSFFQPESHPIGGADALCVPPLTKCLRTPDLAGNVQISFLTILQP